VSESNCKHPEFYFYPTPATEAGWKCSACPFKPGEPPGFSPGLDRSHTQIKVMGLLLDLHNHDFVYVSNGSHGEGLEHTVAERCKAEGRFDQYSILLFILEAMTPSHAKYWKGVSDGIVAGKDPRNRCPCGKLAQVYTSRGNERVTRCFDCDARELKGAPF
jgi:hypothetical protein